MTGVSKKDYSALAPFYHLMDAVEERIAMILNSGWVILHEAIDNINEKDLKQGELIYVSRKDGEMETLAEVFPNIHFKMLRQSLAERAKELKFSIIRENLELKIMEVLSPAQFKVYAFLRATMGQYNIIPDKRVRYIAEKTKQSSKTVQTALTRLEACNIIYEKDGRYGTSWRMNPACCWNGPLNHSIPAPALKWDDYSSGQ